MLNYRVQLLHKKPHFIAKFQFVQSSHAHDQIDELKRREACKKTPFCKKKHIFLFHSFAFRFAREQNEKKKTFRCTNDLFAQSQKQR